MRWGFVEGRVLRGASVLFFLSGATSLAYQVVWFKRLSHLWGNSTLAMAVVVASFLAGLGIGAHLLGRIADRVRDPLAWYGVSEIGIGALALAVPLEIAALGPASAWLWPRLHEWPAALALARFALTFAVLAPPCVLMGGTLPFLARRFTRSDSALGPSSGWLYALNTLGAAAGCWAAGFHLLPMLGLGATNGVVAASNLLIGVVAIVLSRRTSDGPVETCTDRGAEEPRSATIPAANRPGEIHTRTLHTSAALTGCAAIVLEVVWTRQLALMLGGSTYAFSAMLAVMLVGMGSGSLIYHFLAPRLTRPRFAPALVVLAVIMTVLCGVATIGETTIAVSLLRSMRASLGGNALVSLGASVALELLPSAAIGFLFPLLVQLTRRSWRDSGKAVGGLYAVNTLGAIVGAVLASIVLLPRFGSAGALAGALAMYTVALALLWPSPRSWKAGLVLFLMSVLAAAGVWLGASRHDPRLVATGAYMYGPSVATLDVDVLEFREGPSATVLVTRFEGRTALRVNGKVDASDTGDMPMQLGAGYFPLFVRPDARDILVIGLGSGTTSGVLLLFPDTRVTCCEIEPGVIASTRHFAHVNHSPLESARFALEVEDGRCYLQSSGRTFDLIVSEPSNPWISGPSNLFTLEFYQAVREHLAPGGILAQWVQSYSLSRADYAMMIRTVSRVFPHLRLVRVSTGDTLLLAAVDGFAPAAAAATRAQAVVDAHEEIRGDLGEYFGTTDVRSLLLRYVLLDTDGMRRLVDADGAATLCTDLNLRLEFDAPLRLFGPKQQARDVVSAILEAADAAWFERYSAELGATASQAAVFHDLARLFDDAESVDLRRRLVATGLALEPVNSQLHADRLILSEAPGDSIWKEGFDELADRSHIEANRVAVTLFRTGRHELAAWGFSRLLERQPRSPTLWTNRGIALAAGGNPEDAESAFERALEIDPLSRYALAARSAARSGRDLRLLPSEPVAAEPGGKSSDPSASGAAADED